MSEEKERTVSPETVVITAKDGTAYEVPAEGSLPLLALGYKGLMAWRAKRLAVAKNKKSNPDVAKP